MRNLHQKERETNQFAGRKWPSMRGLAALLMLVFVASMTSSIDAQELNTEQARSLNSANKELKRLVANFDLAQQSAGTGTAKPKGSKAKLTKLRLDMASESVPKVQAFLDALPSGNENVKAHQQALDEIIEAINALNDRLNGKPAEQPAKMPAEPKPDSTSAPSPTPATSTVKLDYKQVEVLKNAQYHLRTVEGAASKLVQTLADVSKVEDPETVDFRIVKNALATLEEATRKAGFSNDHLQKLPTDGKGVADVASRLEQANRKLEAAGKTLIPLDQMLSKLIDPANYPQYKNDLKRLQELGQMFRDPTILVSDLPRASAAWQQIKPAAEEGNRIAQAYQRLIQQQTEQGKRIAGSNQNLSEKQQAFAEMADKQAAGLPNQIQTMFGKIREMANGAVANKKPMFFTGGIPQQLGFVQDKLDLLKALNEETSKPLFTELKKLNGELKLQQQSLSQLIIEQNSLPNDAFEGTDRQKAIDVAVDGWKHQQKEFNLLATRVPAEAWSRETRWEYNNGSWYFVDRSKLAVFLIVADKENADFAIIRPVRVIKDHQKGDTMIGVPMYAGDDELLPNAYLLRSKIK